MTRIEPSWDEAREIAFDFGKKLPIEVIDISHLIGRVIAIDARSLVDLPTYETSAMDGYVVCGSGPWKVVGEVKAGAPFRGTLNNGEALGIATGAVIPDGAFGVIRWENALVNGEILEGETSARKDFRPAGEEAKSGETLIQSGTSLNPGMVGLLAASGYDSVPVFKKPRVALLLLGDEIQLSGTPKDGLVRDSLGPQLPGWFENLGCEVIHIEHVSDTLELTIESLSKVVKSNKFDLIATTGGTADGPRDFVKPAINKLGGKLLIDKVAVRPGHPQIFGEIEGVPLIALPGNPQSAVVALMTLGGSLIDAMFGRDLAKLRLISSDDQFDAQPGFTRLVLGNLESGRFRIGKYLGSAMLRSLAHAEGFAICTNPPTTLRWLGLPL